jgi:hypothetical protein
MIPPRPGHDRVRSDTRRSSIPGLLPDDKLARRGRDELREDAGRTTAIMVAFFGLMLLSGIGLMYALTQTSHRTIGAEHSAFDNASRVAPQ